MAQTAKIEVSGTGTPFRVTVSDSQSVSRHTVHFSDDYYQKLTDGKGSKADWVRAAFQFLLDREPKECILSQFDMTVIRGYFPEFESDVKSYL